MRITSDTSVRMAGISGSDEFEGYHKLAPGPSPMTHDVD